MKIVDMLCKTKTKTKNTKGENPVQQQQPDEVPLKAVGT